MKRKPDPIRKFRGYKLAPETRTAIVAEYERGDRLDVIADRHKTSPVTVGHLARAAGVPQRRRSPRFSRKQRP